MGRFETSVEFYPYREPYPAAFFDKVAARLQLARDMRMLDVGCGPGNLAIGFAHFVGSCTAIDREPEMLRAARLAAAEANVEITLIQTALEDLDSSNTFDFVTIGRALHWLSREPTLAVLDRIVDLGGRIAICGSSAGAASVNGWVAKFKEVRNAWASDHDESRYYMDMDGWFAPSRFRKVDEIAVEHRHVVTISQLIGRALSFSITSPAVLGERRPQFEAELRAALEPFARSGEIEEEVVAKATVFG
ncbi:MAG: class I SAM-dependent methyltransferase [Bryobacteraceae bacterium]